MRPAAATPRCGGRRPPASDFFPVPCCFPTCRSVTYLPTDGEDAALVRLIDRLEARLQLARMVADDQFAAAGIDGDVALGYVDVARRAVTERLVGYAVIIAEKP